MIQPFSKAVNLKGRLLRGGFGTLSVQTGRLTIELALSIILARLLGSEGYGIYAFVFTVVKVLQIPAESGLGNLVLRFTAVYKVAGSWSYLRGLWNRLFLGHLIYGILCAIALLLFAAYTSGMKQNTALTTAALLSFTMPLAAFFGAALRGLGQTVLGQLPEHTVRPLIFLFLLAVGYNIWVNKNTFGPEHGLFIHGVAVLVAASLAFFWLNQRRPDQVASVTAQFENRKWLKAFLPLCFMGGMSVINNNLDILMLGWLVPASQVGNYRVAVQGANLVAFSLMVVNFVIGPEIARLYNLKTRDELQNMITWGARTVLAGALPIALVFWIYGRPLIHWVFGDEFNYAYYPLIILTFGQLINAASGSVGFILNMTGHEKDTAMGFTAAAIANVVLNLLLIPRYQALGAATATAVSMAIWNILLVYIVYRRTGINSTVARGVFKRVTA